MDAVLEMKAATTATPFPVSVPDIFFQAPALLQVSSRKTGEHRLVPSIEKLTRFALITSAIAMTRLL